VHLGQRHVQQIQRHVVQRLQHQRQVEAAGLKRDRLRACRHEGQPRLRAGEVLGMLALVHLQRGDFAGREALQQLARQLRRAAAEFDDARVLRQVDQAVQQFKFISDPGNGHGLGFSLCGSFRGRIRGFRRHPPGARRGL
jgi:hypothetical protein